MSGSGVILYVDDKIHQAEIIKSGDWQRTKENSLFNLLNKELPVIGVNSLELAKQSLNSISSFSAIILDWQYTDTDARKEIMEGDDDGTTNSIRTPSAKEDATLKFLKENDFYSLVYVLSEENIEEKHGQELSKLYSTRIKFEKKGKLTNVEATKNKILEDISKWKDEHKNLSIPLTWAATINKSTQQIFKELSDADSNWLTDIYETASKDGLNAALFVIDIFQFLLAENLIQSNLLIDAIKECSITGGNITDERSIAKLFSRLFYSKLSNSPIMTGDICKFDENTFGILITPECDIQKITNDVEAYFDVFIFKIDSFDKYLCKKYSNYEKRNYNSFLTGSKREKEKLDRIKQIFNQNEPKYHILPSFPCDENFNKSIVIDFANNLQKVNSEEIKNLQRKYKVNSPFIQQLRQRYIAYFGRVGVPAMPESLRNFNLK